MSKHITIIGKQDATIKDLIDLYEMFDDLDENDWEWNFTMCDEHIELHKEVSAITAKIVKNYCESTSWLEYSECEEV